MIAGLFSDLLELCSGWFLYIFIDENADLPTEIMNKRQKQINQLRIIDQFNFIYTYEELKQIVYNGVKKRYDKTPIEILDKIYNNAVTKGSAKDVYFDIVKTEDETSIAGKGSFWVDVAGIFAWIIKLLASIGSGGKEDKTATPDYKDWSGLYDPKYNKESSMTTVIPVIIGGAIIYYLFSTKKEQK